MERRTLSRKDAAFPDWAKRLSRDAVFRLEGGTLPASTGIAVVGSRKPTRAAEVFAFDLASSLARRGVAVWSGGAVGIDRAAHEGAVAVGGATVAVIGSGLERPFPPENEDLFARLRAGSGVLLSPFEDRAAPERWHFLARNRVIAAAVDVLVVVACTARSGALNAASAARSLGKTVAVVPHAPWDASGAGCVGELMKGAKPVDSAEDVLALVGIDGKAPVGEEAPEIASENAKHVLSALSTPKSASELVEVVSLSAGALAEALLELEIHGVIEDRGGLYVRRGAIRNEPRKRLE